MRIVICGTAFPAAVSKLKELFPEADVVVSSLDKLAESVKSADVLIPGMASITGGLMRNTRIRLVQQWGIGLEGVDIQAATALGIPVCNVPSDAAPANAESTAEQAVFLMLASARRCSQAQQSLLTGPWGHPQGLALFGCRALIVGLGRVGQALAKKLIVLGMTVDGVKRSPDPELARAIGLERLAGTENWRDLLPDADFVISTLTANPGSLRLFNRDVFDRMKPGRFFINVSRGAVVDEQALLHALNTGRLGGAGLDVFADEPVRPDHPLLKHENVFAMPHTGGVTVQCYEEVGREVLENLHRLEKGLPLNHQANRIG